MATLAVVATAGAPSVITVRSGDTLWDLARRYDQERDTKVTFDDVAGIDEAENELVEIVDFLKAPDKYTRLGGTAPGSETVRARLASAMGSTTSPSALSACSASYARCRSTMDSLVAPSSAAPAPPSSRHSSSAGLLL